MLANLFQSRPGLALIGAICSLLGTLPAWLLDVRDALGVLSVCCGAVIGVLTIQAQLDARRERRRQIAELERLRFDPRGQPWTRPFGDRPEKY